MAATTDNEHYTIKMAIRDWLLVDGTMDNYIHAAIHGYLDDDHEDEDGHEDEDRGEDDDHQDGGEVDREAAHDLLAQLIGQRAGRIDEEDEDDQEDDDQLIELPAEAQLGSSIRQAGWDQIPDWPTDSAEFATWPAPGRTTSITLNAAQWDLVITAMLRTAEVDDDMDDEHAVEDAAESRAIAAAIQRKLTEQGRAAARGTGDESR